MTLKKKRIIQVWEDQDEFYNSPEFHEVFEPYADSEKAMKKSVYGKSKFIQAYKVEEFEHLDFWNRGWSLYRLYETTDGVRLLKKVEAGGCLSTAPWENVRILANLPEAIKEQTGLEDSITFTGNYYRRDQKARQMIADAKMTMTLSN